MILEVQHETHLSYSALVTESIAEARMEPPSDAAQTCRSFALSVTPQTDVFRYRDGLGNTVHHFNLLQAHREVRILAASIVETHPRTLDPLAVRIDYPLDLSAVDLDILDFLKMDGPVRPTPRLNPLLEELRPTEAATVGELVLRVADYIYSHFEYAPAVTLAHSPIDDVLQQGKGVCQDFTHLMIAILRSFGVPARYVSGYIHRPNKDSQSHAWCEVWLPGLGWLGIDPTNNCRVNDHFVKVATGRDFTDVPPNKGIYRGEALERIFVRVETRELESLPSRSWQEQLPPLNVPLTAIVPGKRLQGSQLAESEQQQQ
jgi:transglutaminase-like putative cysteine protease